MEVRPWQLNWIIREVNTKKFLKEEKESASVKVPRSTVRAEVAGKKAKVESHYRDKEDRSNRARFGKPISKLQPRLKKFSLFDRRARFGFQKEKRESGWKDIRDFAQKKRKEIVFERAIRVYYKIKETSAEIKRKLSSCARGRISFFWHAQ